MRGYKHFGSGAIIKKPYRIWNKKNIDIGKNVFIAENSFLAVSTNFGSQKFSPLLKIGDNTSIGGSVFISCIDRIEIESDVILSDRVFISDHAHDFEKVNLPIKSQRLKKMGNVILRSGCFVGVNAVILPGVIVGKNSVIGASSVVTKNVPDYSIFAGNPAKLIRKYNFKTKKWER